MIGSFQEISEERIDIAVGQDKDQVQVEIETELDVSDAKNMIILPRIAKRWW